MDVTSNTSFYFTKKHFVSPVYKRGWLFGYMQKSDFIRFPKET